MKLKNRNVQTVSYLIAKDFRTGATLKCGALLHDRSSGREFVLLDTSVDLSLFLDPKYADSSFVRLSLSDLEVGDEW